MKQTLESQYVTRNDTIHCSQMQQRESSWDISRSSHRMFSVIKGVFKKFHKFYRETPMLESLFNKAASLQAWIFIKKRLQHRCFPVSIAKFLRTPILEYVRQGLLLYFWNPNYKQCNLHTNPKLHFQF